MRGTRGYKVKNDLGWFKNTIQELKEDWRTAIKCATSLTREEVLAGLSCALFVGTLAMCLMVIKILG